MLHPRRTLRLIGSRPRLFSCLLLGLLSFVVLPGAWHFASRALVGWNCGITTYLVLVSWMMHRSPPQSIRRRAAAQDEGQLFILVMSALAAVASIAAIIAELATVKDLSGAAKGLHISLAILTIFTSWAFIHVMFALHYAHEYYLEADARKSDADGLRGGLIFPGDDKPTYGDFLYFSFAIGCASATSDTNVTSKPMRRIVAAHSALSFFFNATVLALTINIAAGLI